jgi:hypothetical protein
MCPLIKSNFGPYLQFILKVLQATKRIQVGHTLLATHHIYIPAVAQVAGFIVSSVEPSCFNNQEV